MNLFLSQIAAIVWKDFVTELKTRELFSSMFIFALLVILIFIFSVNLSVVKASEVGPGILWVAFLFSGTIGLNRSFMLEQENGCLMGLMLVPADRTAIYFGKLISNFIFLSIMELFILPLFMIFFNIDILEHLLPLLLVIFLGTLGFCALGTLLSSLASNLKSREIMLPILLYPLLVPHRHRSGSTDRAGPEWGTLVRNDELDWFDGFLRYHLYWCLHYDDRPYSGGVTEWITWGFYLRPMWLYGAALFIMCTRSNNATVHLKKIWNC